jgi:beta-xylosidase
MTTLTSPPNEDLQIFVSQMAEDVRAERVSQWTFYSTLKKNWPHLSDKELEETVMQALSGGYLS